MKILVIDDEPLSRHLLKVQLEEWKYEVQTLDSCEDAFELLKNNKVNFIICDWVMPGEIQGIDLVRRIRSNNGQDYIYIIMLTMRSEKKDIIEGISSGVDDYIRKPFDFQDLRARIKMGQKILALKQENLELKKLLEEKKNDKCLKTVTGLYNREFLYKKIEEELDKCRKKKQNLSLMLISIGRMKGIKHTYGFEAMDEAARDIAKRLGDLCSSRDFIGRISDEDFLLVTPNSQPHTDEIMLQWCRSALEDEPVAVQPGINVKLSVNIGMVRSDPSLEQKVDSLIQLALSRINWQ